MKRFNSLFAKKAILVKTIFLYRNVITSTNYCWYWIIFSTNFHKTITYNRAISVSIIYVPCNNFLLCCIFVACLHCCVDRKLNILMAVKIFPNGNLIGRNTKIMPLGQFIILSYFTSHLNYRIFLFIQTSNNCIYRSLQKALNCIFDIFNAFLKRFIRDYY